MNAEICEKNHTKTETNGKQKGFRFITEVALIRSKNDSRRAQRKNKPAQIAAEREGRKIDTSHKRGQKTRNLIRHVQTNFRQRSYRS